jgi:hypothetical protein
MKSRIITPPAAAQPALIEAANRLPDVHRLIITTVS